MLSEHVTIKFGVELGTAIELNLIITLKFLTRNVSTFEPRGLAIAKFVLYVLSLKVCE